MKKAVARRSFQKKNIVIESSDWDGTESYWTDVGKTVLTTDATTPPIYTAVIRYLESDVDATSGFFDLDFPDDDSHSAGNFTFDFTYPSITSREIHILTKDAIYPTRLRIDYYNGATKLAQIFKFQVLSDPKVLKYGIRIRFLVAPSTFDLFYNVNDEQHFSSMGLLLEDSTSGNTTVSADVAGKTYYPSMPLAYVPGGVSQLGYASDYVARIISLVALAIAILIIIYVTIYSN